jgi:hypothetical protein
LVGIKQRIVAARRRTALVANAELIGLYQQIGREILEWQATQGWRSKVIEWPRVIYAQHSEKRVPAPSCSAG